MDISTFISSSIIPQQNDTCLISFPSFSWFCETALYQNKLTISNSYWKKELFPHFRTTDFNHDVHIAVFASNFFWYVGVRIIDTNSIYQEKLFLIEEGEIFSFFLKGDSYFAFIYTNFDWEKCIYTNLQSDTIFFWKFENNIFSVFNSLTEIVVFEKKIPLGNKKFISSKKEVLDTYTLWCMEDPFSEEFNIFLEICIQKFWLTHTQKWVFHFLNFKNITISEIYLFIGFMGKYNCIISDDLLWLSWYITLEKAWDNSFNLPETFISSENIEFLDPRWEKFRTGLLEISYMEYLLSIHIELLKWGMESIEKLQNEQIVFQHKRLELTLFDAEILYTKYQKQKQFLINILKQKIS